MIRLAVLLMFSLGPCFAVDPLAVWNFERPALADNPGWRTDAGTVEAQVTSAALSGNRVVVLASENSAVAVDQILAPGLYEFTVQARGTGVIVLSVAGAGADGRRTLRLDPATFGLYGLLFAVGEVGTATVRVAVQGQGGSAQLDDAAITPADADQHMRWAAAQESWKRFGYFGVNAQRPAPGVAAVPTPVFSPENLARWRIRERVVFDDPTYDENWVQNAPAIAAWFTRRGLTGKTAAEVVAWCQERVAKDDAVGTSLLLAYGVTPTSLLSQPWAESPLARYAAAGGRVVVCADVPFWKAQAATGPVLENQEFPRRDWLGLASDRKTFFGMDGATLAPAGKVWGLEPVQQLVRPVVSAGVSVPLVTDPSGGFVGVGMVNLRADAPLSGVVFVPDQLFADDALAGKLRNLYRLMSYSGEPVTVPDGPAIDLAVASASDALTLGSDDRRTAWLRSERLPVRIRLARVPAKAAWTLTDARGTQVAGGTVAVERSPADLVQINLKDYAVGEYRLKASVGDSRLERLVLVSPERDDSGTHISLLISETSPRISRIDDTLRWLHERGLEPMFGVDASGLGRDRALWHGLAFSSRQHGGTEHLRDIDIWRRTGDGQVMRAIAFENQRIAKGYAHPARRAAEAENFRRMVTDDAQFPAWNGRVVSGDDWSQWFGPDYHQAAKDAFKAKYGLDLPVPAGMEDTDDLGKAQPPAPGLVADDHPWLLANRFWSEDILGDTAWRLSEAARTARPDAVVGMISGGMQIPAILVNSGMYPPWNNGPRGWSLTSFYYYNTLWQPPLAHFYYLQAARMGARGQQQYVMPDCAYEGVDTPALYVHFGFATIAGGATGLQYFRKEEMTPGGEQGMRRIGALGARYGQLIRILRPARAPVAMLVTHEALVFKPTESHELAYAHMDLMLGQVDVETLSPEEPDFTDLSRYRAVVLPRTQWLKRGTAKRLADYIAKGGTVVLDATSGKYLNIPGAKVLDVTLGDEGQAGYGSPERLARIRAFFADMTRGDARTDSPATVLSPVRGGGIEGLWLSHTLTPEQYRAAKANGSSDKFSKVLADAAGFDARTESVTVERVDDGTFAVDVIGGTALEVVRVDGRTRFTVPVPMWQSRLVAFVPAVPARLVATASSAARVGADATLKLAMMDSAGNTVAAPWPMLVTVTAPDGSVHRGLSQRVLATAGTAEMVLPFANNDPTGTWSVTVEDRILGLKTTLAVPVAAR